MIKKIINNFFSNGENISEKIRYVPVTIQSSNDNSLKKIEEKSLTGCGNYLNLFDYNQYSLASYLALDYYAKIQPVNSSIDKITEELSSITPVVFNIENDQFVYDHEVLKVLDAPNPYCKYSEFIKSITLNYLVTGNAFIVASGEKKSPVKELYDVSPRNVELNIGPDGYINRIVVQNENSQGIVFVRTYGEINGRRTARFLNSNNREIFHIKNNNPYGQSNSPWGFSRLTPIIYEMEQYLHSNKHNLSLLTKGARPSMAFVPSQPLTDEQFTSLQEQIQAHVAGSSNAGTMLLFPQEFKGIEMSVSNKDMDYESLRKNIISAIHTQLGVPLPLVIAEEMTLANMQTAMAQFYQNTVIPVANRIFSELTDILMPRYDDKEQLIISFDRRSIPALELEAVEAVKVKASLNVMTDNEIRTEIGLEHLQGGDVLYKPGNMMPTGKAMIKDVQPESEERTVALSYMINKMKSLTNDKGERLYPDEKIGTILKKYNING